jgi:gluconolactonase
LTPFVPLERARVFFDGGRTPVRLRHAECVAVDRDGAVWCGGESGEVLRFANGMALAADGTTLYLVETLARRVVSIAIGEDGAPREKQVVVEQVERLPDGLALDVDGNLLISCYEPSRIYRRSASGDLALLSDDPDAHMLCHPTNCAFRGSELFIANLGRCHITHLTLETPRLPLPVRG